MQLNEEEATQLSNRNLTIQRMSWEFSRIPPVNDGESNIAWQCFPLPMLSMTLRPGFNEESEVLSDFNESSSPPKPCLVYVHPPDMLPIVLASLMTYLQYVADDPTAVTFSITKIQTEYLHFARDFSEEQRAEIFSRLSQLSYVEIIDRLNQEK